MRYFFCNADNPYVTFREDHVDVAYYFKGYLTYEIAKAVEITEKQYRDFEQRKVIPVLALRKQV